jgi:hypothetical protein
MRLARQSERKKKSVQGEGGGAESFSFFSFQLLLSFERLMILIVVTHVVLDLLFFIRRDSIALMTPMAPTLANFVLALLLSQVILAMCPCNGSWGLMEERCQMGKCKCSCLGVACTKYVLVDNVGYVSYEIFFQARTHSRYTGKQPGSIQLCRNMAAIRETLRQEFVSG